MYPEIPRYESEISLVADTGLQFMDFALSLDIRKEPSGQFARLSDKQLTRLFHNADRDYYFYEPIPGEVQTIKPLDDLDTSMKSSLALLDGLWLPLPFFRFTHPARFEEGPCNWARARLIALSEPDIQGHTHRLTLAFDTRLMPSAKGAAYLAPNEEDLRSGSLFRIAFTCQEICWFLSQDWVSEWLQETYRERIGRKPLDEINADIKDLLHLAHYLNFLSLMSCTAISRESEAQAKIDIPNIKVIDKQGGHGNKPISVDLILDVGNSRTCGILIEDHAQSGSGLQQNYILQLRDLGHPDQVYGEAFQSSVEFSQASFGKDHLSVKSGRHDAFQWPTIARVGGEAARLAARRIGTEGSTGLSSPKRYLWDEKAYDHGWRCNTAYVASENEPLATAAPFSTLINDLGEALYTLEEDERMPVFSPKYSRSSLMTFMLAEVLTQALSQINSPGQRSRQGHARTPRCLRKIILTVPPGMPQAERSLFHERVVQARNLVWASLGWIDGDLEPGTFQLENEVQIPDIIMKWDEASCGQMVYLYTEICENYAGHPEEFFADLAQADKPQRDRITVGTIDIGGGTTDLVITDYRLNGGQNSGSNVFIVPEQRFRDGFKVAGDDILLDVIQLFILPSLEQALKQANIEDPGPLMSRLCGSDSVSVQDSVLRQQLNLQVFTPLALRLLKDYEVYDPDTPTQSQTLSYQEWLGDQVISPSVRDFINTAVSRACGRAGAFELSDVQLTINLAAVHEAFFLERFNLCKTLTALCEVVHLYQCDILLLTGRPSSLPGIPLFVRKLMPLVPSRILPLQHYRSGSWFPFHVNGRIQDPKSTASVGAMLCWLCENSRLPNFYFQTSELKPYSTLRHLGIIDSNNIIKDADLAYENILVDTDSNCIQLPEYTDTGPAIEMRGDIRLGFRQLSLERWSASPLYNLKYTDKGRKTYAQSGQSLVLRVALRVKPQSAKKLAATGLISDRLEIASATSKDGEDMKRLITLELNTMLGAGLGNNKYWLDSGSVKRV
ncbi:virulence factor SrfB [Castellaniella sp.]|uniref:virulence factor SrfB n=1 Tax=Castellaniella sp. TaxID=1955812 RepID=UPI002AFFB704|nr:virulence factor SrfB [Castellaniella sp.]